MASDTPRWDQEIRRRLESAGLDPARESEIVRELSQHLDDRFAELRSVGVDVADARRRTLAELDEHEMMTRELSRVERLESSSAVLGDTRRQPLLAGFWQDVRYGARSLRSTPGFTAVAVVTLALGIGATTAIFSVVDSMLLRPLTADPDGRVVRVHRLNVRPGAGSVESRTRGWSPGVSSIRNWQQQHRDVFEAIGAWGGGTLTLLDVDPVERVSATAVMPQLLRVFDSRPAAAGRLFVEDDTNQPVAVISHDAWHRRFGGDPGVIGRSIRALEGSRVIIGVLPPGFPFQTRTDFWIPLKITDRMADDGWGGNVLARLRPGVTVEQARDAMAYERRQRTGTGGVVMDESISILSMHEQAVRYSRQTLYFLLGGVGCLLLISCVNVAGLLIARGSGRRREVAIRASLGAGRSRLIRQLLTESLLLSALGGVAGLVLGSWLMTMMVGFLPINVPADMRPALSLRLFGFCTLASVCTGFLFGLLPAVGLARTDLSSSTKPGRSDMVGGVSRSGRLLVTAEVALALILLVGAGLMIRSLQRLLSIDSGFDVHHALIVEVSPVLTADDPAVSTRVEAFYQQLVERLASLPGVTAVGAISSLPYWSYSADAATVDNDVKVQISPRQILPGYFAAVGMPLRAGRDVSNADRAGAPCVVVVNEEFVRRSQLDAAPLGHRVKAGRQREWCEIVGVVANVRHVSLEDDVFAEVYYAARQTGVRELAIVMRAEDPSSLAAAVRTRIANLPERTLIERIAPFEQLIDRTTSTRRNRALLFSILGGLGVLLASIGIFGLTAYAVSRRTREIGVRVALGATPRLVLRGVMRDFVPAIACGIGLGLFGAWAATRTLEQFLFGVTPHDPVTLAAVSLLLLAFGLLASYLPARRALRIDPVIALRSE